MSEELIREVLRRQEASSEQLEGRYDSLSEQVEGVSRRYDSLTEQIGTVLRRQDVFSDQLQGVSGHQDALASEYAQLVEFLGQKFDSVDRRFDAADRRFVRIEIALEGVHDQIKILAEGIGGTHERLDRFLGRLERLEAG